MSTNAARLSDADVTDLMVRLNARTPRDLSAMAPRASVVDITTRKPLGLSILDGSGDEPKHDAGGKFDGANYRSTLWDGKDEDFLASALSVRSSYEMFDALAGMVIELHNESVDEANKLIDNECAHRKRIESLEGQMGELRAALVEARHEVRELKLIQESMRIANRGERGVDGARGVPGRDGLQGPVGPRGEKGEPGAKAAGFILNLPEYSASLVLSDGAPAATLRLRPMFEQFAEAIAAEDETA